jgi:hypothetical protein
LPERKVFASFRLTNQDLGLDEEVEVMINPWDFGWTFGRDARLIEESTVFDEKYEYRDPSFFFMRTYNFKEQSITYDVDENLNLHQKLKLRFTMNPKAERPSSQTKGLNAVENLRKGVYILRVLVRRNDTENEEAKREYITHGETLAKVTGGELLADITLDIDEYHLMRSRNRVIFELATVHEDCIQSDDGIEYYPKKKLKLENFKDKRCYNLIGKKKTKDLSFDDIIDYESGLAPALFEGPIVLANTSWTDKADPYVIQDYEVGMNKFIEQFQPYINKTNQKSNHQNKLMNFSNKYINLNSLIKFGKAQKLFKQMYYEDLSKKYASENRLVELIKDEDKKVFTDYLSQVNNENLWGQEVKFKVEELSQIVKEPLASTDLLKGLCNLYIDHLKGNNPLKDDLFEASGSKLLSFKENCFTSVKTNPVKRAVVDVSEKYSPDFVNQYLKNYFKGRPAFTFVRQYEVGKVNYLNHKRGIPQSYGIKTGYSIGQSYSFGTSAGSNLGTKLDIPGGIFGLSGSAGASVSWRWSRGTSVGTGFSLGLDIEESIEEIELVNPKQCLTVRLAPWLVDKVFKRGLDHLYKEDEELAMKVEAQIRSFGLFICNEMQEEKIQRNEHYYYLEQKNGGDILLDSTDERNRSIKIMLRGKNEFYSFIERFEGELSGPNGTVSEGNLFGDTYNFLHDFTLGTPGNFPGIYTDLEETSEFYKSFY